MSGRLVVQCGGQVRKRIERGLAPPHSTLASELIVPLVQADGDCGTLNGVPGAAAALPPLAIFAFLPSPSTPLPPAALAAAEADPAAVATAGMDADDAAIEGSGGDSFDLVLLSSSRQRLLPYYHLAASAC